ncbi:MAG: NAD(P) transhydrogenase subunit alpha, partial [Tardiphaga sp.]
MASDAMDKALDQLDQAVTAVMTAAAQAPEAA